MIKGTAHVFGHHLNTDVIHPPEYFSFDPERVRLGFMKGVDPTFLDRFSPGDILIAGENFGCGSSRETSIYSMLHNKVGAVVAISFARIFFRNAINNGLPIYEFVDPLDYAKVLDQATLIINEDNKTLQSGGTVSKLQSVPDNLKLWLESGIQAKAPTPR